MEIKIYGHPNQKTHTGFNSGRLRIRHDKIMAELKRVLDNRGVEYSVDNLSTSLTSPFYNAYVTPYKSVLDGHTMITLNDKISWSRTKHYSVYFHVKTAANSRVTYNCRAGLVACIGDEVLVRNFKFHCPGKYDMMKDSNSIGTDDQLYSYVDEDANGEIDIEGFVDKVLEKKKEYEAKGKQNILANFANDMQFNMVKTMVVEALKGIENRIGGKEISMLNENEGACVYATSGDYRPTFKAAITKCTNCSRINVQTYIDYDNNAEYEFFINRDNSEEAKVYIQNIFKTLKELHNSRVAFRFNREAV